MFNKIKKIKLAFLIGTLKTGGAQNLLKNILENLNKDYFKIYLIFWRKGEFFKKFIKIQNIKIIQLKNKPKKIDTKFLLKIPIFIKQYIELRKLVKKERFEIIHSHLLIPDYHNFLLKLCFKNLKIISTKHEIAYMREKLPSRIINKIINSKFNKIIACSFNTKKFIQKFEFTKNIEVIYNGVNLEKIDSISKKSYNFININDFNLISIGRLEKIKGFDHLIKTFNIFNNNIQKTKLFICGEGKEKNKIKNLIKKFQLNHKVVLLGNRSDIISLLKSCNLFILLSNREAFPISILEAMSCHLPVVASNVGGVNEIVINEKNGYLVNRHDYIMTANIICKLAKDPKLRKRLGENSYKLIEKKYNINSTVIKYENEYLSMLN